MKFPDGKFFPIRPVDKLTVVQDVTRELFLMRDRSPFESIESQLSKHDKVLVVYGSSHLRTLKRALSCLLSKPELSNYGGSERAVPGTVPSESETSADPAQ